MFTDSMQIRSMAHLREQQIQAETERQQLRPQSPERHRLHLLGWLRREKSEQMRPQKTEGTRLAATKEAPLPETAG